MRASKHATEIGSRLRYLTCERAYRRAEAEEEDNEEEEEKAKEEEKERGRCNVV